MAKAIKTIPTLGPRPDDAHKGLFGKVLIIGGSRGMVGAPALAANAALRSGAGLVRVAVPEVIQLSIAQLTPCATTIPLAQDAEGLISRDAIPVILQAIQDNDALALGPGIAQSNELQALVESILNQCDRPIVIDADGLNNLAAVKRGKELQLPENAILTPHPGEMSRLWQAFSREPLPLNRSDQAEKLAERCGAVVVLKGAGTIVTDGKSTYVNETGNPGMATAGSGDVLTGCIAALIARQEPVGLFSPFEAAVLGVFVHGRAGDLAAAVLGETSVIATDILDFLPDAWQSLAE